jgi:hypothetical protein
MLYLYNNRQSFQISKLGLYHSLHYLGEKKIIMNTQSDIKIQHFLSKYSKSFTFAPFNHAVINLSENLFLF